MSIDRPPAETDPAASSRLQVLATEHWSLLATRSLTYNESLSRVSIFLAILSGGVITLALVAQADHFGSAFIAVAIPVLGVVLFTGVATVSRLMTLNRDDYRWVVGMNRLRHAYLELHPELEPYFIASPYDDPAGALTTLGIDLDADAIGGRVGSPLHVLQTLPGMLSVITAVVAGAIGALTALGVGIPAGGALIVAVAAFVVAIIALSRWGRTAVTRVRPALAPRFTSPPGGARSSGGAAT